MKKVLFVPVFALLTTVFFAQNTPDPKLLGPVKASDFQQAPYAQWYNPGHQNYTPNPAIEAQLKQQNTASISIKIVFGSWCGDSKRELPRMMKLLNKINFPAQKITLIGVDNADSTYKQSPGREDRGLHVFRVPTFIVYENGVEINRINESPVESLERDLLKILRKETYAPNFGSYAYLQQWLKEGLLSDENINYMGLANQIRHKISSESELNAAGYYWLNSGNEKAALTVLRMNAALHPNSANVYDSLGDAQLKNGNKERAIVFFEQALKLNPEVQETRDKYKKLLTVN
ncbi:thioredoxin family protein [Haliscomenobacter hydrossis]|nr:thioredoxin family protein [Haliscomenobacter hydrossis]